MKKLISEKVKKSIIVYSILWLLIAIVFVVPITVAYQDAINPMNGRYSTSVFGNNLGTYLTSFDARVKGFKPDYIENTKNALLYYSIFYAAFISVLILKSKNKGSYHNIEHGSSDWCEGGEQYKVLSKNKGIILAENNYLPVDKPGNVNVLIVGRFWIW